PELLSPWLPFDLPGLRLGSVLTQQPIRCGPAIFGRRLKIGSPRDPCLQALVMHPKIFAKGKSLELSADYLKRPATAVVAMVIVPVELIIREGILAKIVVILPAWPGRREDHTDQGGQGNIVIAQAGVIGLLRGRPDRVPNLGR